MDDLEMEEVLKRQTIDLRKTIVELQRKVDSITLTASKVADERSNILLDNHTLNLKLMVITEKVLTIERYLTAEKDELEHKVDLLKANERKLMLRIKELENAGAYLRKQLQKSSQLITVDDDNDDACSSIVLPPRNNIEIREADLLAKSMEVLLRLEQDKQLLAAMRGNERGRGRTQGDRRGEATETVSRHRQQAVDVICSTFLSNMRFRTQR